MTTTLTIALGTRNADKNHALHASIIRVGMVPNIYSFPIASGIDENPVGAELTALGAENRAIGAIKAAGVGALGAPRAALAAHAGPEPADYCCYGIGCESGLEWRRGFCVDSATIVLVARAPNGTFSVIAMATSVGIPIPRAHVLAAYGAPGGIRENTAGEMWHRVDPTIAAGNWHPRVTHDRLDRVALLTDAFYAALSQVF